MSRYGLAWPRLRARLSHATASTWSFMRTLYRIASGREAFHLLNNETGCTPLVIDRRKG